CQQYYSFTLTF
nr:immunoglobulin light chain junction region [Macaca mulatta]